MNNICIDINAELLLINYIFLTVCCLIYVNHVFRKLKLLKINDIDFTTLFIDKYIFINFFILNEIDNKTAIVCFIRYIHIVDNFKTNIFLNNNILRLKNIVLYINKNKLTINNCDNFIALL